MARAILDHEVFFEQSASDRDLQVSAGVAVTVFEIDGTTPFAGTIYDAPSGGSVVVTPTTSALGLLKLYTAPENARRVKLTVAGLSTQFDSEFRIDPVDAMTLSTNQTVTGTKTGGTYASATLTTPTITTPTITNGTATGTTLVGVSSSGGVYWLGPTRFSVDAGSGTPSQKIATCMALYRATLASGGATTPGGAEVWFPQRAYDLTEPVDFSNLDGLKVMTPGGPGNSTWLYCSSFGSSGIIVDLTGTNSCEINGLTVSSTAYISGSAPTNKATAGWMLGSSNRGSNKNRLINCGSFGFFTVSAFAVIGASNLSLQDCAFQQAEAATVIYISADNAIGLDNIAGTLYDAGGSTSDIAFKVVEAHSGGASGGKVGARNGVVLRGVSNFSWEDGVNDCYDASSNHVFLTSVSGNYCGNISIRNVRHYIDQSGTNAGTAIYVNDRVDGLELANCPIQSGIGNLIAGPTGMILNRPMVHGDIAAYGFSGTVVTATGGAGGTINGGYIECAGLQINVGSGTTNYPFLNNVGTVTAGTPNWVGTQSGVLVSGNIKPKRLMSQASAPTFAAAVTATGWGDTASGVISGTEMMFTVTVTCNASSGTTGITANPTIQIAYPGSAYTTAPKVLVTYTGADNTTMPMLTKMTRTTSGFTITTHGMAYDSGTGEHNGANWTPTKTQSYEFTVLVAGGA